MNCKFMSLLFVASLILGTSNIGALPDMPQSTTFARYWARTKNGSLASLCYIRNTPGVRLVCDKTIEHPYIAGIVGAVAAAPFAYRGFKNLRERYIKNRQEREKELKEGKEPVQRERFTSHDFYWSEEGKKSLNEFVSSVGNYVYSLPGIKQICDQAVKHPYIAATVCVVPLAYWSYKKVKSKIIYYKNDFLLLKNKKFINSGFQCFCSIIC